MKELGFQRAADGIIGYERHNHFLVRCNFARQNCVKISCGAQGRWVLKGGNRRTTTDLSKFRELETLSGRRTCYVFQIPFFRPPSYRFKNNLTFKTCNITYTDIELETLHKKNTGVDRNV